MEIHKKEEFSQDYGDFLKEFSAQEFQLIWKQFMDIIWMASV